MKRYLIAAFFSLGIILLYHFYPINFFKLDLPTKVTNNLFNNLSVAPGFDTTYLIINSGKLTGQDLKAKIDTLLTFNPSRIGINLCDVHDGASLLEKAYAENPNVTLAICSRNAYDPLSWVINDGNRVTHFRTRDDQCFEFTVAGITNVKARGNDRERINYYGSFSAFSHLDMTDVSQAMPEVFQNKIILIGYCGDYVSAMDSYTGQSQDELMRGYEHSHITPMNEYYGYDDISPDMYDIQISANIIRMIREENFITDSGNFTRALFILFCAMLLVLLITVIRTRWLLVNLVLCFICYSLIIMGGTLLIVIAFENGYYLEIPELSIVLTVVGVFTILYNLSLQKRKADRQA